VCVSGTVMGKSPKGVVVQLRGPIKRGDGIVLDRGKKKHLMGRQKREGREKEGRQGKGREVEGLERSRRGRRREAFLIILYPITPCLNLTYYCTRTHTYTLSLTHTHTCNIGSPEEREEGGAVYEVLDHKGRPIPKGAEVQEGVVTLSFGR
jgi:hypothetical protein